MLEHFACIGEHPYFGWHSQATLRLLKQNPDPSSLLERFLPEGLLILRAACGRAGGAGGGRKALDCGSRAVREELQVAARIGGAWPWSAAQLL